MKNLAIIFLLVLAAAGAGFAQEPENPAATPTPAADITEEVDDTAAFTRALNQPTITDRIAALKKFSEDFPESESRRRALEIVVSLRAELGDQKLRLSDLSGIELFKLAVNEAPTPISDKLFTQVLIQFPTNLFFHNQPDAANEVAKLIEEKIGANARQLVGLAAFYLGTEYASEGLRLAEKAIASDPTLPAAYQILGLANRISFDLEGAVKAYEKALELDPASTVSKRSLAEMKRATGQPAEALRLYREILAATPSDGTALTGLILSLFDNEQPVQAEEEMVRFLQTNPRNLFLLVGAAYWYAAHNEGAKAIELADAALAVEPRYTWAYIARARGLIQQQKPVEAERTLLLAKQYGNFPTLDYEIAAARLAAGFFQEAADQLAQSFSIRDGLIETNLGGRVPRRSPNFLELLSFERRASIFEPLAADNPEAAARLKNLLRLTEVLAAAGTDELELGQAVDEFVSGTDNMKVHRQLFVANRLLLSGRGAARAFELTRQAIGEVDRALDVADPAAAVLAEELYPARVMAAANGQYVLVPEVPIRTLSKILRGRIEELSAQALYQQEQPEEAVVRLNRAISVLPENSAWWRSSNWRLGTILAEQGKPDAALQAYVAGYNTENPDPLKRNVIESLYQQINGNTDGLDELIGAKSTSADDPAETTPFSTAEIVPEPVAETPLPTPGPTPETIKIPENVPFLRPGATPEPTPAATSDPPTTGEPAAGIKLPENVPTVSGSSDLTGETGLTTPATGAENAPAQKPAEKPTSPNSLFEPIVIRVPKSGQTNIRPDEKPVEEKPAETTGGETKEDPPPAAVPEKPAERAVPTRPRIVPGTTAATDTPPTGSKPCSISVNQENISILNDGGSLGMFVGFEDPANGDPNEMVVSSSSPDDITAFFQTDIAVLSERAFLRIISISPKTGVYTVTLEAPCGKREIKVTVR